MNKGFSLIEMLVVLAILTIMAAIILVDRGGLNDNLILKQGIDTVAIAVHTAQVESLAVREDGASNDFSSGYGVYLQKNVDEIIYFIDRNGNHLYEDDEGINNMSLGAVTISDAANGKVLCGKIGSDCDPVDDIVLLYKSPSAQLRFFRDTGDAQGTELFYEEIQVPLETFSKNQGVIVTIGSGSDISIEQN